ncbi:hypothetical protein AGDE_14802 [Angomonas deanei]|uniref:Uncharacterized protein n=1 Tax=Angomonas deanei TaxID=59799 RepID=A0A7G2CSP0_9TRYP|nr:hypothetical protein AGDE_14802 [Angomonas deanei]CAD2221232.1 hypothetical protein, conserved [Angomonas deanei]|eukprot:EPY20194.1 hypothetical protein AGDE_14802 [Angomonas deanei]
MDSPAAVSQLTHKRNELEKGVYSLSLSKEEDTDFTEAAAAPVDRQVAYYPNKRERCASLTIASDTDDEAQPSSRRMEGEEDPFCVSRCLMNAFLESEFSDADEVTEPTRHVSAPKEEDSFRIEVAVPTAFTTAAGRTICLREKKTVQRYTPEDEQNKGQTERKVNPLYQFLFENPVLCSRDQLLAAKVVEREEVLVSSDDSDDETEVSLQLEYAESEGEVAEEHDEKANTTDDETFLRQAREIILLSSLQRKSFHMSDNRRHNTFSMDKFFPVTVNRIHQSASLNEKLSSHVCRRILNADDDDRPPCLFTAIDYTGFTRADGSRIYIQ